MRKQKILIIFSLVFLGFFGLAGSSLAATYYVDNSASCNDSWIGSEAQPWCTIQKASNTMVAGDIVYVQAGTYNESVNVGASGSDRNLITYQAVGHVHVNRFRIDSKNYIKIDGFQFNADLGNYNWSIAFTGTSSHCIASNNTIVVYGTTESGGIALDRDTSYLTISGNDISNNFYYPAIGLGGDNQLIENNTIHDSRCDAFQGEGFTNSIIRKNILYQINYTNPGCHADLFQIFGDHGGNSYNVIVEDNYAHDSDCQPMMMTKDMGDVRDWTFRNNVFVNIRQQGFPAIPGVKFFNNTFYHCAYESGYVFQFGADLMNVEVKNNFFIGSGGTLLYPDYGTGYSDAPALIGADYNYYAKLPTDNPAWGPEIFASAHETHYINSGDPLFVDYANNNFHLQSASQAKDAGVAILSFSKDKEGISRPQGSAWDIGAYEYVETGGDTTPPAAPRGLTVQ